MQRKTRLAGPVVCAMLAATCSGSPQTMVSPSAVDSIVTFVNADGSTLKVGAPRDLAPNGGGPVQTQRPTLTFNSAVALFVQGVSLGHEIEIQNATGTIVYGRTLGETQSGVSHPVEVDLSFSDTFWWRARARLADQVGPWSAFATFRTPDPPTLAPTPTGGSLPFPVPAECGPFGPDNRFACAAAVAAQSAEWRLCAGGRGVNCHRFVRQVVYALSRTDANWRMIVAAPGGHACNCSGCGGSDGTMFREDTTAYGGNRVFDLVVGAGGPSPSLSWSPVPGPRAGDSPSDAPLCAP